jgi:glycosyltransferase involved in cell wall biosynthesis
VPSDRVVVRPNAVDATTFRPDAATRHRVRAARGFDPHTPVVLFVGNFYEWHDVGGLLAAMALVVRAHPQARLVLVGDGATRGAMEARAAALGIADRTCFVGKVSHPEVPSYMAAADVAVVPYPVLPAEVWLSPLKLFEGMASGLATVATAAGQVREVIRDGENGRLVPPGDAEAMAAAIASLLDDPVARHALGERARRDAVDRHSWDHYIADLEQVFADAIGVRNGRRPRYAA